MVPFEQEILALLGREPGLKGREIAQRLGTDKAVANSSLFKLRTKQIVHQDSAYRWKLKNASDASAPPVTDALDTPLAKLCRYYLQCLSLNDEGGVSLFAESRYSPEFVELPTLPEFDQEERPITSHLGVSNLLSQLRNSPGRKVAMMGYPVRLRFQKAKSGWEGYKVEPIFLFELGEAPSQSPTDVMISGELPGFNFEVLKSFAVGNETQVMDEAATLAEELGFSEPTPPELDDMMARLVEIRPEWDWKEQIDPSALSSGVTLSAITAQGIYNRAIIFGTERSVFTRGLEQELAKLQTVSEGNYRATALGSWLNQDFNKARATPPSAELLEPLPLNSEQREAVENALANPITVITGPPGTGKSQVVSSILINAARRGRKVLFASKNNKAVDVVETRVNALGPRPVLLRLGKQHQANLTEYLTELLASRNTPEDTDTYNEAQRDLERLTAQIKALQARSAAVVNLRNSVDAAEREAEPIRTQVGADWFAHFRTLHANELSEKSIQLAAAAKAANKTAQGFLTKSFWFAVRKSRLTALRKATETLQSVLMNAGIQNPPPVQGDADVQPWIASAAQLRHRSEEVRCVAKYYELLEALTGAERLEDLAAQLVKLSNETGPKSLSVWEAWLVLAPARLTAQDRRALGDFSAVLRLISQSDAQNQRAGRDVFSRYYRLFPHLVSQLPCWAVTSLSARGRIPLEPGFFDLLVIDEASQCDIASIIPLLYRAKTAVIIGDPMQLRHISAISTRRDRDLLQQHGLAETRINWAFSENSVFDLASPLATADDIIMLRDHHRSHADIIGFSNKHFYGNRLRVATNYDRLRPPVSGGPAVRWIEVDGSVTKPGSGALNKAEAEAVVEEIDRLIIQQGYKGTIGVVTPFRAQANFIRDLLSAHPHAGRMLNGGDLWVDTVHRFQGDERDTMLFSAVVSGGFPPGAFTFLRKSGNLFNVAITRARASLVIVGNSNACKNSDVSHLADFARYVDEVTARPESSQAANSGLYDGGSTYPVVARPESVSDWERLFYCELYQSGLRTIPQYDVEKYTLDLALIDGKRRLDIEVDGERYHRDWNGELLRRDQLRNMRMVELGWDVMRFWVYELRDNMPHCIERVRSWKNTRS